MAPRRTRPLALMKLTSSRIRPAAATPADTGAGPADADRPGERGVLAARDQRVELLVERQDDDALVGTQALEERLTELLRVRAMSLQFGGEIVVDVERAGDRRRHADSAGRARTRPNLHPASVYHSSSARPASASIASVDSRVNL